MYTSTSSRVASINSASWGSAPAGHRRPRPTADGRSQRFPGRRSSSAWPRPPDAALAAREPEHCASMKPAALMGGVEHLRGGGPEPLVVIGDDELHARTF